MDDTSAPPATHPGLDEVDVLSDLVAGMSLIGSVQCRADLQAPWGLEFAPRDAFRFHIVERGSAWLTGYGEPIPLSSGDVVLLQPGLRHCLLDTPTSPIRHTVLGMPLGAPPRILRAGDTGPWDSVVCGSLQVLDGAQHPLVDLLPAVLHLPGDCAHTRVELGATVNLLALESAQPRAGAHASIRRLTEVLFVQLLRAWIERTPGDTGWLAALRDPRLARAVSAVHRDPAAGWTLPRLAAVATMSRSGFAALFTKVAGESPMQHTTRWRISVAARLLREQPDLPLRKVAAEVGYDSEDALARTFRRHMGRSPAEFRRQLDPR